MPAPLLRRLVSALPRPHLPRPSVRSRFTLLYSGLFLASGVLVLAVTYGLVDRSTDDAPAAVLVPGGGIVSCADSGDPPAEGPTTDRETSVGAPRARIDAPDPSDCKEIADHQHADQMRALLVQSSIALGITMIVSVALGWIVAGRVLRPIRHITATARTISEWNLHDRLAVTGPDDELKELADTFDELLARLERSFDAQRRFVANASHELRTPLARQRTVAQVALDDPDATIDSLRTAHQRVLATGSEQERLIDALLTLARGHTGLEHREPIDLGAIAGGIVDDRHDVARRRQIIIDADLAPALALGNRGLAERLVANLVDNAILHNHPGGTVRLTSRTEAERAIITVTNTGPVVPPEALDGLFEPFRRLDVDRTRHDRGLGLGLSIVRAIANTHNAALDARPALHGGLEVEIAFPATSSASVRAEPPNRIRN